MNQNVVSHEPAKKTLNWFFVNLDCQADSSEWRILSFDEIVTNNKKTFYFTFLRRKHSIRKESSFEVVFCRTVSKVRIMLSGGTTDELELILESQTKTLGAFLYDFGKLKQIIFSV